MSRAPKYCSHHDTDGTPCMELVPGGVRNCNQHQSRWDRGRSRAQAQRTSTGLWKRIRNYILKRDNYTCVYCGAPATTVDHVVATAHGGTDDYDNLVAACQPCNDRKARLEALESRLA